MKDVERDFRYACGRGDLKEAKELLEKGVDINVADEYGLTPLMMAAQAGRLEMVEFLLENKAEVNHYDRKGWNALFLAAYWNCPDVVKLLIKKGENTGLIDKQGFTLLSGICTRGEERTELLKLALKEVKKGKIDIDAKDYEGNTALMYASSNRLINTVKLLVEAGANVNLENNRGFTAIDKARGKNEHEYLGGATKNKNNAVVEYLLTVGAEPGETLIMRSMGNNAVIDVAISVDDANISV